MTTANQPTGGNTRDGKHTKERRKGKRREKGEGKANHTPRQEKGNQTTPITCTPKGFTSEKLSNRHRIASLRVVSHRIASHRVADPVVRTLARGPDTCSLNRESFRYTLLRSSACLFVPGGYLGSLHIFVLSPNRTRAVLPRRIGEPGVPSMLLTSTGHGACRVSCGCRGC